MRLSDVPYVVCRKPSGVHFVVPVSGKDEAMLYEVALRQLFEFSDDAEKEVKRLEKARRARHKALVASQQKLFDDQPIARIDYA